MRKATPTLLVALALAVCCFPAAASAGTLVPPGNSAANQYTETFPTSKGEEDAQGKKKSGVTAAQVLGAGKAHKLEDQGAAGKAVADFAAETSPAAVEPAGAGNGNGNGEGNGTPSRRQEHRNGKADKGGQGNGGAGDAGEEERQGSAGAGGKAPSGGSGAAAASSGSSGAGEIASQATGFSSGAVDLWLPLILIAVLIWSAFYVWRDRQQRVV